MTRVFESIYCRIYYSRYESKSAGLNFGPYDEIPEERCKNAWIQGRVASLKGWQMFLDCVPGMNLYALRSDCEGGEW
jgi:hypothetical protein